MGDRLFMVAARSDQDRELWMMSGGALTSFDIAAGISGPTASW